MSNIYSEIEQLSAEEISDVLDAVIRRYSELFPGWEIATFSLHMDGNQNDQIDRMINLLENSKTGKGL